MSEFEPLPSNPERDRLARLAALVEQYFPEDKEFVKEMDFEEALGFVYGMLLMGDGDPDEILYDFGVIEREEGDEI